MFDTYFNMTDMTNVTNIANITNIFAIYNSSELLQNLLEDENKNNISENKIIEILQNEVNRLNIKIPINICIEHLISLINDYKIIQYNYVNINTFIKLSTYFLLNNTFEFIEYIATDYILRKQMFYQELCNFGTINSMLVHIINNDKSINLDFNTIQYIQTYNIDLFKNITSLTTYAGVYSITTNVLKNFSNLVELCVPHNKLIHNLNFLLKLQILDVSNCSLLYNNDISKLTELKVLTVSNCSNITDVNIFQKLVYLDISGWCGVDRYGIKNLSNIKILNISDNVKITDVSHLKELVEIDIRNDNRYVNSCPCLFNYQINIIGKRKNTDYKDLYEYDYDDDNNDDDDDDDDDDDYNYSDDDNNYNNDCKYASMSIKEKLKYYQIKL